MTIPKRLPTRAERISTSLCNADHSRQNTLWAVLVKKCRHKWQPVQLRMETELLYTEGTTIRADIRQPDTVQARVFVVCLKCLSWSYYDLGYAGFYLNDPDLMEKVEAARIDNSSDG